VIQPLHARVPLHVSFHGRGSVGTHLVLTVCAGNPTEFSTPGQPRHGICVISPTPITTSSERKCTPPTSRSQISELSSTMSVNAMPAVMQAPLRAETSDSTGTQMTTDSETESTGVAPGIVAGQVGVLAVVVAFLLA